VQEFSHALDEDGFRRPDLKEAAENSAQQEYANDSVRDESEGLGRIHVELQFPKARGEAES